MLVVDTNVISAMMEPTGHPGAQRWLDAQKIGFIHTSSVTLYEIQYGLRIMPEGRRRRNLEASFTQVLRQGLSLHILDFDPDAAVAAAEINAQLRAFGRSIDIRDLMIAGIAAAHGAALATRNTRHFADTGLTLVDPWAANDA